MIVRTLVCKSFVMHIEDFSSFQVYLGQSEQSTLAGTYCSNIPPKPITSKYGFYIIFKADSIANGNGFRISYKRETIQGK